MASRYFSLLVVALLGGCAANSPDSAEQSSGGSGGTSGPDPEPPIASQFPILFVSPRSDRHGELYVMRADGSDVQRLGTELSTVEPVWSPDGALVAFRRVIDLPSSFLSRVELMSVDDGGCVVITGEEEVSRAFESSWPHGSIAWSPDGETLAFASTREADDLRIWLTAKSGGQQRLAIPDLEAPHYSPSFRPGFSGSLAYVAQADGTSDIWLVDIDRPSERQSLTRGRIPVYGSLRWTPAGDRLAFTAIGSNIEGDPKGSREIYFLALETLELTRVTDNEFDDLDPIWSPDGSRILFSSDRDTRGPDRPSLEWFRDFYVVSPSDPERVERLSPGIGGDVVEADWYWPRSGI